MISSLFNESEHPTSNNEIVEVSISLIDFDRNKYKSLFIFIYHYPDVLALIKMDESNIQQKIHRSQITIPLDIPGYTTISRN
jgi:hypothetical protein